jgi:hypothetical protein
MARVRYCLVVGNPRLSAVKQDFVCSVLRMLLDLRACRRFVHRSKKSMCFVLGSVRSKIKAVINDFTSHHGFLYAEC